MSQPNMRRHSINVMSFSSPEGGLLPDAQHQAAPWSLMLSEEDIPTLGKLKKLNKKLSKHRGSSVDLRNHGNTDIGEAEGELYRQRQRQGRDRRSSVLVIPGMSVQDTNQSLEFNHDVGRKKKSKKPKRKLSFAGILPFIFNEKARRKKSVSLEDSDVDSQGHVTPHRPDLLRKMSSTSSESSGCHDDPVYDGRNRDHHHGDHRDNGYNGHFLAHLKNTLKTGSHGSLRSLLDPHGNKPLENLTEESNSIAGRSSYHSGSSLGDEDTIKGHSGEDDWLSSQDTLANQERLSQGDGEHHHDNEEHSDSVFPAERSFYKSEICHHGDCLDDNSGLPLILCTHCDTSVHSSLESEGHLRFNLAGSSNGVAGVRARHGSSHSLPEAGLLPETSTSDTELEISRHDSGEDTVDGSDVIRNTKLQRKKGVKIRRHNTENEQKALSKMLSKMHTRSRSYQEFSALDLSKALDPPDTTTSSGPDLHRSGLYHGDSGVVMTTAPDAESLDPKKRVLSVDSLPLKVNQPSGGTYVYSDKRNMPILDTPSPRLVSPAYLSTLSPGGRVSPNVFILPDANASDTPTDQSETGFQSSTPLLGRSRREGTGSHPKKARSDVGPAPPHPFGRKHSVPAMLLGGGSGTGHHADGKLNLGAVECFKIHFDIVEELIKDQDVEIVPAIKGVTLREAVTSFVEKRGLNFDMVDFFIAASQSPLQVDMADCYFLAGADLHVKAKQSGEALLNRQGLGSTKSTVSNRSAEKRPLHMYLKRDQSVRHNSSSCSNGTSGSPSGSSSTSVHRWSSLRPRSTIPSTVKNEPHPLAQAQASSLDSALNPDDETKGSRSDLTQTVDTGSPHGTLKGSQPLKGIGKLFGGNRKPDLLQELLQTYKVQGLPSMPDLLQLGHKKFDSSIFQLEASWTDLVSDTQSCDKYQQEAIWELLKTEVAYIKSLQFVIDLFLATLYNLQTHALLNDIETEKIFSNISDLHQANCQFYETHMYKVITTARETGQPLDPTPLIQGFLQFHTFFEPYSKFCIEYMGCQQYLTRMKEENELFRMYLNWTENNPDCHRLTLRDFIAKPFHRLTKYKLLLERIWKSAHRPDNAQEMISKVDQFICQVNATVTQLEIMRRIDSYDAVDLPNNDTLAKMVGPFCRLDLTRPIPGSSRTRYLIEEGTLRMNNRTDVICFLFTDMLLITKATSRKADINNKVKVKVYKPPMRLDKIFVNPLNDGGFMLVYLNEYNLATTAYTFHGDHAKQWLDRIRQTQDEYEKLRNAIMDQSEAYLLNLANGYETYDDEYAYMNARSVAMEIGLDRVGVNRKISVSSADTFMGNASESGRGDMYRARSALSIPGRITDNNRSPRDSPPATPLVTSFPNNGATHSRFQSPQDQLHLGSGDGSMSGCSGNKNVHLVSRSHLHQSNSSPGSCGSESSSPQGQFVLPPRVGSDDIRKVKQRRDRRYYTADMIQDLRHKDSSIQKRLSWHSGAKDTDYDYKQGMGKLKTVSTDSLRSFHSSSGVSSVGSLHMNPDNEISEESSETNDWAVGDASSEDSSQASDTTTKTACITSTSLEYPLTPPPDYPLPSPPIDYPSTPPLITDPITPTPTSRVNAPLHVSFSAGDTKNRDTNLPCQNKVSKSMPDISSLSIVDEAESELNAGTRDRSSTVDGIREGQQRRKLSDSQSRRLKLQILNSTLEATDV